MSDTLFWFWWVVLVLVGGLTIGAFLGLKDCIQRRERAVERIDCLQLNSGRTTSDLVRVCGDVEKQ